MVALNVLDNPNRRDKTMPRLGRVIRDAVKDHKERLGQKIAAEKCALGRVLDDKVIPMDKSTTKAEAEAYTRGRIEALQEEYANL